MRAGWVIRKAGDLFEMTDFVSNGSFASLRENVKYLDHPDYAVLVRLADYSNDFDSSKFVYVSKQSYDYLAKSKLFGGEIIISNVGSVGKSFICPDLGCPMTIGPNAILLRSENNAFFQYYFQTETFQKELLTISSKATLLKFNKTNFKTLDIPVPSPAEQQRIVDILDQEFARIDALKSNAEKSLQAAKDLFQATLQKELEPKEGWITHDLGNIADFKNGLNFGKEVGRCCYRFLGVGDFKDNLSVEVNNLGQIFKDEIDVEYLLQENDVVFVRSNGSKQLIGRCLLVKNVNEPAVFSGFCIRCRLKENALLSQFLTHLCTMDKTKTYLTSSGGGCNISNLNQRVLSSLKISAPQSITEQERIVSIIETHRKHCNTLQENYQKTIALCDDLKQALLHKAFNGEL